MAEQKLDIIAMSRVSAVQDGSVIEIVVRATNNDQVLLVFDAIAFELMLKMMFDAVAAARTHRKSG